MSDISTDYLRWYNLSVPVPVQQGDVLGIFNQIDQPDAIIYHQQYSGPLNYYSTDVSTGSNEYPLVSVIVGQSFHVI